jgi:hypothetical protein
LNLNNLYLLSTNHTTRCNIRNVSICQLISSVLLASRNSQSRFLLQTTCSLADKERKRECTTSGIFMNFAAAVVGRGAIKIHNIAGTTVQAGVRYFLSGSNAKKNVKWGKGNRSTFLQGNYRKRCLHVNGPARILTHPWGNTTLLIAVSESRGR